MSSLDVSVMLAALLILVIDGWQLQFFQLYFQCNETKFAEI